MKNLFKTIALALVLMTSASAFAQRSGLNEGGVNFGYQVGSKGVSNFGIGVKYGHMFSDNLRLELGGMYYFKGASADASYLLKSDSYKNGKYQSAKNTSWFDIDLNAHYLFEVGNNVCVYPIFGFTTMIGHTSMEPAEILKGVNDLKPYYDAASKADGTNNQDLVTKNGETYTARDKYTANPIRFGVNLGFGGQYDITDDFAVTLEAKYKLIKDFGNFNVMLGCVVLF